MRDSPKQKADSNICSIIVFLIQWVNSWRSFKALSENLLSFDGRIKAPILFSIVSLGF